MFNNNSKKVFFITSNYLSQNNDLEYILPETEGVTNFKVGKDGEFTTQIDHAFNKFVTTICSFEIIPSKLKRTNRDPKTKLFKVIIKVKDRKSNFFNGYIFFRKYDKNTFIYDFKFECYRGMIKDTPPPVSINFTKCEQFKLYLNFLKEKEILISEDLGVDLIQDSQNLLLLTTNTVVKT